MSAYNNSSSSFSMFPPFIKFLMIFNVVVYLATSMFFDGLTWGGVSVADTFTQWFALWPIDAGFLPWQLVSYQYMHGGLGHLFFNMLALWMFGMELENMWGSRRFALYYTLAGIFAGATQLAIGPLFSAGLGPTIGASGSIMGVLLAFGLIFPRRPIMVFPIFFPIPARIFVMLYAGLDLVLGLMGPGDGVAHFAHLGGALGGYLLLKYGESIMRLVDKPGQTPFVNSSVYQHDDEEPSIPQRRAEPRPTPVYPTVTYVPAAKTETPTKFIVDGDRVTQESIDEILDKISQAGYHSLTEQEKKILYEVSKQL